MPSAMSIKLKYDAYRENFISTHKELLSDSEGLWLASGLLDQTSLGDALNFAR